MGSDLCFGPAPEVVTGHERGGAEGQPGHLNVRSCRCSSSAPGMVRRGVIPDEQLRHVGVKRAERRHAGAAIVLAAALTNAGDAVARGGVERPRKHPPSLTSADHPHPPLAPLGPPRPQPRELPHARPNAPPHPATPRLNYRPLLSPTIFS